MFSKGTLRAILIAPALALVLAVGGPAPAAAAKRGAAEPLAGNGMWIWYVSASGGGAERIARRANRHNVDTVLIKSSDAGDYWDQFSADLVDGLQDRGVRVCAWQFVYGNDPRDEARQGARAVHKGADCLVIDAEGNYEGRYAAADRYIRRLRREIGDGFPLALAGFPYVDYHPAFPFSVFLGRGGATMNAPQLYWRAIGTSVRAGYAHTFTYNRPYDRPMFPLGQTWQDPPRDQVTGFRRYAEEYGADGVSWWSWQETNAREWHWVGKRLDGGVPGFRARRNYPLIQRGSEGDIVVLAQELLRAFEEPGPVSGSFGRRTHAAVERFQSDHDLEITGAIGDATWRALTERRPARIRWAKRRAPASAARAPASASLRPLKVEVPWSAGVP